MTKHNPNLSSTEMAALWRRYMADSLSICLSKYFLHHVQDHDTHEILKESVHSSELRLKRIADMFQKESFPVPHGYTEEDVNVSAPPLFTDTYVLGYLYMMSHLDLLNCSMLMLNCAKDDVLRIFSDCIDCSKSLYERVIHMMLKRGIYERPPQIPYPDKVEFIAKQSFMSGVLGERRPLNVIEITELFFNIERNCFAMILLLGFIQTVQDEDVKQYLVEGKKLAEDQIDLFNKVLKDEDLLGSTPLAMEVTTSTVCPFSEKLIMGLVNHLNSAGIVYLGYAIANSMRVELVAEFGKIMTEILRFAGQGMNILIDRGWIEQPPQAPDRKQLADL